MNKTILFVDDEPNVLSGLKRMLWSYRQEWDMRFVTSGQEALAVLSSSPVDVIVSDMRMPGMDGATLMTKVTEQHPEVVRIILSGQSDNETVLRSISSTHQFLSKPCDAEILKETVSRAFAMRNLLNEPKLKELVSKIDSLPSLPTLYLQLVSELQSESCSPKRIGEIITRDVGMSAKILQLVNSAFFGLKQQINDPIQAAVYLGIDTLKSLVMFVHIFTELGQVNVQGFSMQACWHHSMEVGTNAKAIAKTVTSEKLVLEQSFTAGLLHDIGKLIFAANFPEQFKAVLELVKTKQCSFWEAEDLVLHATHAQAGGYLLGLWGLPDPIVEAVTYHHYPDICKNKNFSPLTAVTVANSFSQNQHSKHIDDLSTHQQNAYLAAIGMTNRWDEWQQICASED